MAGQEEAKRSQLKLFPTDIVWVFPPTGQTTADCRLYGRGSDGCDYALKDAASHPLTPHSEWFCTKLGEMAGIAAPPCVVAKLPDQSLVFASRWEGGVIDQWWTRVKSGEIDFELMSSILSKIYAFDQFVSNTDRHANNFLVRQQRNGYAFLAFDYSRAWLRNGSQLTPPPLPEDAKTVVLQRQLATHIGNYINPSESKKTLDKIRNIGEEEVEHIIKSHPNVWLPEDKVEYILKWWISDARQSRLDAIEKGIVDGSYL